MNYRFSTQIADMDFDVIHRFLTDSYWAKGISKDLLIKAIGNSLCFGVFENETQIAFGRFVTDRATFAYLADVFVVKSHRGKGIGQMMMQRVFEQDDLQGLRRIMLATRDAHSLYEKFDFQPLNDPDIFMQRWDPDVYLS